MVRRGQPSKLPRSRWKLCEGCYPLTERVALSLPRLHQVSRVHKGSRLLADP